MFKIFLTALISSVFLTHSSNADVPNVVTDITPIHSLVSIVMNGVGSPGLIIPSSASPHDFAFRPSQAGALQKADIVFWVGEDLTPWLLSPIQTLAKRAESVALIEDTRTHILELGDEEHEGHDHDDAMHDPHAWLDPQNAIIWLDIIAERLSALDAEHSDAYQYNAEQGKLKIAKIIIDTSDALNITKDVKFIVAHDAYAYFAARFGLDIVGAITASDGEAPSAKRVADVTRLIQSKNVKCVFVHPGIKSGLVDAVIGKSDVKRGEIDPLGAHLEIGVSYYSDLITDMAASIRACVTD